MSKVAVTFGRGNPPTAGHKKLADKVKEIADKEGASYELHWSHSQDTKKNPLDHKTKVSFMKKLMPSHRAAIKSEDSVRDPISLMKHLESKGHKEVHLVVGSDRVEGMHKLLHSYNGKEYNFDKIKVHSAGTRDPDAEGVTGISASKMRQHAINNDHGSFHSGLPEGTPHKTSKELFNAVKKGLKMSESVLDEGIGIRFKPVSGTEEHDEVKTQSDTSGHFPDHVYGQLKTLQDPKEYAKALQGAKTRVVKPHEWRQVGNTDAGGVTRDASTKQKTLSSIDPKKLERVKGQFKGAGQIKSPIILHDVNTGHHHLLAGNTRATVGASLGHAIHATFIHYDSSKTGQKMNESKIEKPKMDVPHFSDPLSVKQERALRLKKQVDDIQKQIKKESYVDVVIRNTEELVERMTIQTLPIFFTEEEMFGDAVEYLDEGILSRQERIRRGMNLRKRRAMIQQKRKLKMRRMPNQEEAKRRARKMAIKILKQKFSGGKKMHELSVADKMRLEKLLSARKGAVERIATRLVKKVRDLARSRIASSSAVGKANHPTGVGPVTVKTNKQMVKVRESEQLAERTLTKSEEKKKEEVVMSMKKKKADLMQKYGDNWENVMYATATKIAKESELQEDSGIAQQQRTMSYGDLNSFTNKILKSEQRRTITAAKKKRDRRKKHNEMLKAKKEHAEELRKINMHTEADMDTGSGMSSGNDENDKTVVKNNGNVFDTAKARGTKTGKDDPLKIKLLGKKDKVEVNPKVSRPV